MARYSSSLLLFVSLFVGISFVQGFEKPSNFITNGYYTAHFDDSTVGFFPFVQTGPSHSAGAHKPITYQGNTSYFSVLIDETVYSSADFVQSLVAASKNSAFSYSEIYKLETFNGTLEITLTTTIHGDQEKNSYVTFGASIKIADCDQYNSTDEIESVKNSLRPKFRFLVDVNVNGDDGPTAAPYINDQRETFCPLTQRGLGGECCLGPLRGPLGECLPCIGDECFPFPPIILDREPGFITIEEHANEHTWFEEADFAALSFASDFDSLVNAYDYNVYITTRGLGADAYQFVSWLDASESPHFYYNETGLNITNPSGEEYDDSALIAYYDTQLCSDGEGYHLLCEKERYIEIKLFATLGSRIPTSHQCPYCNINNANDQDGNSVPDMIDLCPGSDSPCNHRQGNYDADNHGDSCDYCPWMATRRNEDSDRDLVGDDCDNCPHHFNPSQIDADGDNHADACDNCPYDHNPNQHDRDHDRVGDVCDNCVREPNPDQENEDQDPWGDACDTCLGFFNYENEDADLDGFGDECDNCPNITNPFQLDADNDTVGDACDNCVFEWNYDQANNDTDYLGDACDNCPDIANEEQRDNDTDSVGDVCDNCNGVFNPNQTNSDGDDFGDECDICPFAYDNEQWNSDFDEFGDACDNCPFLTNPWQEDADGDDVGDICDNCEFEHNPNQVNTDGDIWGDACDPCLHSRWTEDIVAVHDGDAPNIIIRDGCYISDYVDECTKEYCVSVNPSSDARDSTISQTIY